MKIVPFTLGEEFMVWAKSHQGKVYHSVQVYLPLGPAAIKDRE